MSDPTKVLGYYENFAAAMASEIEKLRMDHAFVKEGGELRVSIDFTEIYSYCRQTSTSFLSQFGDDIFSERQFGSAILFELHESIMEYFLFGYSRDVYLLDPYMVELKGFYSSLGLYRAADAARHIPSVTRLKSLTGSEGFARLRGIHARVLDDAGSFRNEDIDFVHGFINEHIPEILDLAKPKGEDVKGRLENLFQAGKVVFASGLYDAVGDGDRGAYQRWFEALNKARPGKRPNNAVDASAIGLISALNRKYAEQRKKVRFVLMTRSEHMHEVASDPDELSYWDDIGGNPLRHPRGALASLGDDAAIVPLGDNRLERILDRSQFLFRPNLLSSQSDVDLTLHEVVNRHIALIRNAWQRYCEEKVIKYAVSAKVEGKVDLLPVLSMLVSTDQYRRAVVERLDRLRDEIGASSLMIGAFTSREMASAISFQGRKEYSRQYKVASRRRVGAPEWVDPPELIAVSTAHGSKMPFGVASGYARAASAAEALGDDPIDFLSELGSDTLFPMYANVNRSSVEFHNIQASWYLMVAYACAGAGAWKFADAACDALSGSLRLTDNPGVPFAEAVLLRSRCGRHITHDTDGIRRALTALRDSRDHWPRDPKLSTRYEAEVLKCRFILQRLGSSLSAADRRKLGVNDPRRLYLDATQLLKKCEAADATEGALETENNVLYYRALDHERFGPFMTPESLRRRMWKFREKLTRHFGDDRQRWPDNYVDTLAFAELHLFEMEPQVAFDSASLDRFDEVVLSPLEVLASHEYLSSVDVTDFRRHADQARTFRERMKNG